MKGSVIILALTAVSAWAGPVDIGFTPYGYLTKIGVPLAEEIKRDEAENTINEKIIGGTPASLGQFPWQAGILTSIDGVEGKGVCGGSLVSNNKLITAAHCWYDGINQAYKFTVILGTVHFFHGGFTIETSNIVTHPKWFPWLVRNDVAVVTLPNPITVSATIAPIALPFDGFKEETFAGEVAVASGFGLTVDGGSLTQDQILSQVQVKIISNGACRFFFPLHLRDSNICIQDLEGRGTCNGDSGGPLIVYRNNKPILVGVTSFGSALGCKSIMPKVFARVTSYLDFFTEQLKL